MVKKLRFWPASGHHRPEASPGPSAQINEEIIDYFSTLWRNSLRTTYGSSGISLDYIYVI